MNTHPPTCRRTVLHVLAGLSASSLVRTTWAQNARQGAVGASFPAKVYQRWAKEFAQASGVQIDYKPTGSGDGIKQVTARSVRMAGTDSPLSAAELAKSSLIQVPMLVGGIAAVVNLPGLPNGSLRLTGGVLADLFLGRITRWNDPEIRALNPQLAWPAKPVVRLVRADKSGTTEGFTDYLSRVSERFRAEVGRQSLPRWPGAIEQAEGNDGVSRRLREVVGGIAYLSHDRILADGHHGVQLRNRDGQWTAASEAGFKSAIVQSDLHRQGQDTATLMDMPGPQTWPITMTSFMLIDAAPKRAQEVEWALRFVYWCLMRGDHLTGGTGFAALPVHLQARLAARLATVAAIDGSRPQYQQF